MVTRQRGSNFDYGLDELAQSILGSTSRDA